MLSKNAFKLCKNSCDIVISRYFANAVPRIACNRQKFNYYNKPAKKDAILPLASSGWEHRHSRGDFFIVNPLVTRQKQDVNEEFDFKKSQSFDGLGFTQVVLDALHFYKLKVPTEIQYLSASTILAGKNTVIAAETGCGKTLAYMLPIIQNILLWRNFEETPALNSPSAIIITPTRELAIQVHGVTEKLCDKLSLKCKLITGGHIKRDLRQMVFEEMDIVISSFGALSKYITNKYLNIDRTHHIVLDEADTLLDNSFNERLIYMLKKFKFQYQLPVPPKGCQLIMASATMPKNIVECVSDMVDVDSIKYIQTSKLHQISCDVPQRFFRVGLDMKSLELLKMVRNDIGRQKPVMIFSNDSSTCDFVTIFLNENGIDCLSFHGNMPISYKKEKFAKFQNGEVNVLSCTDLGSRGLDTTRTKHVINFTFPKFMADYIHRCGRTGRVGSPAGCMITNLISTTAEIKLVQKIETAIRKNQEIPNIDGNIPKFLYRQTVDEDAIKKLPGVN